MDPSAAASSSTSGASKANYDMHGGGTGGSSNSASSSWKNNNTASATTHFPLSLHNKGKLEESDEDMFTVPDIEAPEVAAAKLEHKDFNAENKNNAAGSANNKDDQQTTGKRRRGRNPVDREHRRLKRLLRNRVSAQQARERKKVYVSDLESRATELQDRNSKLEEKISTLINENTMLRKVLLNTRPKTDESS